MKRMLDLLRSVTVYIVYKGLQIGPDLPCSLGLFFVIVVFVIVVVVFLLLIVVVGDTLVF